MTSLSKLHIGLLIGAGVLLFLSVPAVLLAWLFTHKVSPATKGANTELPMDWGRFITRSFDRTHSRRILAAQLDLAEAKRLVAAHKIKEAAAKFRSAIAIYEDEFGSGNYIANAAGMDAGQAEAREEDWGEAEDFFKHVVDASAKQPFNTTTLHAIQWLADSEQNNEKAAEAKKTYEKCLAQQEKSKVGRPADLIYTLTSLARLYNYDDPAKAETLCKKALAIAIKSKDDGQLQECYSSLSYAYEASGKFDKLIPVHLALLKLAEKKGKDVTRAYWLEHLYTDYLNEKNYKILITLAKQARDLRTKANGESDHARQIDLYRMSLAESLNKNEDAAKILFAEAQAATRLSGDASALEQASDDYVRVDAFTQASELLNNAIALHSRTAQTRVLHNARRNVISELYQASKDKLLIAQIEAFKGDYAKCRKTLQDETSGEYSYQNRATHELILVDLCTGEKKEAQEQYKSWQKAAQQDKMSNATSAKKSKTTVEDDSDVQRLELSTVFLKCFKNPNAGSLKDSNRSDYNKETIFSDKEFSNAVAKRLAKP